MLSSSDRVKLWRENMKNKIVHVMGGECCICGYKKCHHCLALHHINPEEKEFSLAGIRACPTKWENIVKEIKKCVLLCHNCHGELHAGLITLPENCNGYREELNIFGKSKEITLCPVCGSEKPPHCITCSKECAGKRNGKIEWDKIDLIEEMKTKTITQIATEMRVSDAAVHKRLKKIKALKSTRVVAGV